MTLADWLVPADALRFDRDRQMTNDPCVCFNAPFHFHACERRPDPAALWGEYERNREGR